VVVLALLDEMEFIDKKSGNQDIWYVMQMI
jgi:hypothetical protein